MKAHAASRVVLLSLFILAAQLSHGARAPLLRYRAVNQPATNLYSLQLEHRSEYGTETLAGNLTVVSKPGPSNVVTLGIRGNLVPKRDPSQPIISSSISPRWSSPISINDAELQFDERGRLLRAFGDVPLPLPLGSVGQAFVEILPAKSETRWDTTSELGIIGEPLAAGPGLLFGPPSGYSSYSYYGSHNTRQPNAVVAVTSKVRYQSKTTTADRITVGKTISLDSHLLAGTEPHISATGEGEFVFDSKTGTIVAAELSGKGVINTEAVTRRTTTTLRLKLLEGAEREAALRPPVPTPVSHYAPKKLTREEAEKLFEDLKSNDANARMNAANKLQTSELAEVPAGLVEFLADKTSDSDSMLRYVALKVLGDHGTKEQVPLFLKWLKSNDYSARNAAIRALGRLKEKSAAEPLAAMLASGSDGYQAVEALTKIGPEAEDAVLPLLKERHIETRRQACSILKQIGTQKSLEPLRELMLTNDRTLSDAAGEAVRTILARQ